MPVAFWAVLVGVEIANGASGISDSAMRGMAVAATYGVPLSLFVMFVLGYPLALLLRRIGRLSFVNVAIGAAAIGAIVAVVIGGFPILTIKLPVIGAIAGLDAAIVFCLVAGIPFRRSAP